MPFLAAAASLLLVTSCWLVRACRRERAQALLQREKLETAAQERIRAETQLAEIEKQLQAAQAGMQALQEEKSEAEKRAERLEQRLKDESAHWEDKKRQIEDFKQYAKASVMEAGGQVSQSLIKLHRQEMESAKKASEETTKKTTDHLVSEFKTITAAVASLKTQSEDNRNKMSTVWRALTTPAGAGHLAEVGLENSLKNLGLEPGRDFVMQYAISGGEGVGLRPDAVIFLPQDMVMVVDSKASKFSLEIAEAEGGEGEKDALAGLARSMNAHLKALQSKDYKSAIEGMYRAAGRIGRIGLIHTVMYLPHEGAVERIKRADPEFLHKAERARLILAGPASLSGLLSIAGTGISLAHQAENQEEIMSRMQAAMESMVTMFEHAASLGKNLRTTASYYDKFAGSVNKRVLPRLRALAQLGVKPSGSKDLPDNIVSYDIRLSDEVITVDAESSVTLERIENHRNKEKESA